MPKIQFAGQSVSDPTPVEQRRLRFPPHQIDAGLRLACQCTVLGDLRVTKFEGLFGQHTDSPSDPKPPAR